MKNGVKILNSLVIITMMASCAPNKNPENEAREFFNSFEKQFIPVYIDLNKAYFNATISGKDEDYTKVSDFELQYSKILGNKETFEKVKKFKEDSTIADEILKRQAVVLYNSMVEYQIDSVKMEQLIKAQTALEQKYSTFRAELNGRKYGDNEIEDILAGSVNSKELENAWLASKQVGTAVAEDVKALVKLRNEIAKDLGYSNYHAMSLQISEQDPEMILKLFDELDELTVATFDSLKGVIDNVLSVKYKISKDKMRPWHYQNRFFQEAPKIYDVDLDTYYKGKDILKMVRDYYYGIGLEVDNILAKSDLYEKEGKNQHAYCTSIDKSGDVRILANVKDNYNWTGTMLHELGHGVYDIYIDSLLPFTLRDPAHTFTTEAIANFFGLMAANPDWMKKNAGITGEEAAKVATDAVSFAKLEKIIFSRWAQVMYRFEKSMYENPDQDLNKLWWDLVEKYQKLKRPEGRDNPDWAAKIHIATAPCYYHNYLLGDLLAAQLNAYIKTNIAAEGDSGFTGNVAVGNYLKEKVFNPGCSYQWNEMIEKATGEKLTAKYYAEMFVN